MGIVLDKNGKFDLNENKSLLNACYAQFTANLYIYNKIYSYYCGCTEPSGRMFISNATSDKTDIKTGFNIINDRTKHKIGTNFIKKFIKEEVSYSVGNDVTYVSRSGNSNIIDTIKYNMAHWDEAQNTNLAKNMLLYSNAFELYYIDEDAQFCGMVISPRHGFAYCDNTGKIIFFLHVFSSEFDCANRYIDIYTDNEIIHCNEIFNEVDDKLRQTNIFGKVPVGIASLSDEDWLDTIYNDIKSLQDSFEINLTNISQEITELRNAYLWLNNIAISGDDYKTIRQKGIIETKGDNKNISASWLVKNINDSFIQNTLKTIEDMMHKITFHIDTNERLPSNTSSLTMRARLINLEQKCKLNDKALANCIRTRLRMLLLYLNSIKGTNYDYKDVKAKFTPNVPMDDMMTAQTIAQLGDKLSIQTALSQLSFVENPQEEIAKIKQESADAVLGAILLGGGSIPLNNNSNTDNSGNTNDQTN
ncbi:phage portal protein [Clostridium pasteurianum]|uniref:Phage portal protein, SPP1 Gp6 n=1 Tax=Clostridium pasteurianum BC1 TaxID=86416 RepID=R4KBG7_CLOPA|nr:phage portal protein [Clostridium pasteurianum]AGK99011.1 Phage portal protein, SPP1 Gp6 [Clostridium pasteurianum BC1]